MTTATTVRERPILFSGPMIQAIREGRKTQTRRIMKPQPVWDGGFWTWAGAGWSDNIERVTPVPCHSLHEQCPYKPGTRLWVRETFSLVPCSAGCEKYPNGFDPARSSASQPNAPHEGVRYRATWDRSHSARWRRSIHMPRWASRILLEIKEVRVERLQSISEADKAAEGATPDMPFGTVWRRINTAPGVRWEDDPWVWAITFRVLEGLA